MVMENLVLKKLESFFDDPSYHDLIQNSARFNTRLQKDRNYRQPYVDGQTGVPQRDSNLYMSSKQRMPGTLPGQVYSYPAKRWKSNPRSYLTTFMQATKPDSEEHTITTVENPAVMMSIAEDSNSNDKSKEWLQYYEDSQNYEEDFVEDDFESEEDFEDETYRGRGSSRRKRIAGRRSRNTNPKRRRLPAKGTTSHLIRTIKKDLNDTENKPYVCELCGMRYKTRPGLTYHYAHSHREDDDGTPQKSTSNTPQKNPQDQQQQNIMPQMVPQENMYPHPPPHMPMPNWAEANGVPVANRMAPVRYPVAGIDIPHPVSHGPPGPLGPSGLVAAPAPSVAKPPEEPQLTPCTQPAELEVKKSVPASTYCDFCLGDSTLNKKSGQPEDLVSCADCGRSGHPSCLQFTENMMKSVTKYRWQCIECKTCTICGTSENDDQLLFCDDCDRGYHLYCLTPPLSEPPEGEWSCALCIKEFHQNT